MNLRLVHPVPRNDGEAAIRLSDPDITAAEAEAVQGVLASPTLSGLGPATAAFEAAFAEYLGRKYAVAVASGTTGLALTLAAYGIGPGDEVIAPSYGFRETAHAIALLGARTVFADIDYWAGTLMPKKAEAAITAKTRAIVAANVNGHPASWPALRALADNHKLALIEDSTEAIGSRLGGAVVGSFGDCAVFDFAQPSAITCGEGAMVVTDDVDIAMALRRLRAHRLEERASVVIGGTPPYQVAMSDLAASLGLAQLRRLDEILERRKLTAHYYLKHVRSFEGIKDPYIAPDVTEMHWFLYLVHLGTRFTRSSRDAIIDDLHLEKIEAAAYSCPLHLQRHYFDLGYRRGDLFVTEKVADRAIALPFHTHLTEDQIAFIVETMKDASVNVGAGSAIY